MEFGRVRASDATANIGVVADGAGKGEALAGVVERLEDEDVGQVHAAVKGIVHDENVALRHVVAVVAHDRLERGRGGAQMAGQGEALGSEAAGAIGESGRIVHVVLEDG